MNGDFASTTSANAAQIAATAHVFQQQSVIQTALLGWGNASLLRQSHPQQAGTQSMPGHRTFRKVERKGQ